MAKEPIKETVKETHKLVVEGDFIINADKTVTILVDGIEKNLADLAIRFNGKYGKLSITEDTEKDLEEIEVE